MPLGQAPAKFRLIGQMPSSILSALSSPFHQPRGIISLLVQHTHLTHWFQSSRSICNYASIVLGPSTKRLAAIDSFPVSSLLRDADISMRTPLLQRLPILPPLLHRLSILTTSLGPLGPAMQVCLTYVFFVMLWQSNMAPLSASAFDSSRHTCKGDIFVAPLGLLVSVRWTKPHQLVGKAPVLLIPGVPGHPATQWPSIISSSPLPPPLQLTNLSSPSTVIIAVPQSQSPCSSGPCLYRWMPCTYTQASTPAI